MSDELRVLFRCDAGPAIGLGHATRCLALAQALAERHGAICAVLTRAPDDLWGWAEAGFAILPTLPASPAAALWAAAAWRPDLVVVDLPELGAAEALALADLPWPVALLDDGGLVPVATRFLVNGNAFAHTIRYRMLRQGVRRLLGPRYVALRPPVAAARPRRRRVTRAGSRLLLTLGGGERSAAVGLALATVPRVTAVDLVLGPLAAPVLLPSGLEVCVHRAPAHLAGLLLAADICIAAGGSTLYEAACLGTPVVALPQSALEACNTAALAARGVVVDLGPDGATWAAALGPAVTALLDDPRRRQALSEAGRRLVDGRGALRLADALVAGMAG